MSRGRLIAQWNRGSTVSTRSLDRGLAALSFIGRRAWPGIPEGRVFQPLGGCGVG
jgi:hypothetical protein